MQYDKEFADELDRLTQAVQAGEVTAVVPLSDELNERGHPYGEELGVIAQVATEVESFSAAVMALGLFVEVRWRESKSPENDAFVAGVMERLGEMLC